MERGRDCRALGTRGGRCRCPRSCPRASKLTAKKTKKTTAPAGRNCGALDCKRSLVMWPCVLGKEAGEGHGLAAALNGHAHAHAHASSASAVRCSVWARLSPAPAAMQCLSTASLDIRSLPPLSSDPPLWLPVFSSVMLPYLQPVLVRVVWSFIMKDVPLQVMRAAGCRPVCFCVIAVLALPPAPCHRAFFRWKVLAACTPPVQR